MLIDITNLYCEVDDFYHEVEATWKPAWLDSPGVHQVAMNEFALSPSEVMTITVAFHLSAGDWTCKHFYTKHVQPSWRNAFPKPVS
jgi:hypothetical protein